MTGFCQACLSRAEPRYAWGITADTLHRRGKGVCNEDNSVLMRCWLCSEPCMQLGIGTRCMTNMQLR